MYVQSLTDLEENHFLLRKPIPTIGTERWCKGPFLKIVGGMTKSQHSEGSCTATYQLMLNDTTDFHATTCYPVFELHKEDIAFFVSCIGASAEEQQELLTEANCLPQWHLGLSIYQEHTHSVTQQDNHEEQERKWTFLQHLDSILKKHFAHRQIGYLFPLEEKDAIVIDQTRRDEFQDLVVYPKCPPWNGTERYDRFVRAKYSLQTPKPYSPISFSRHAILLPPDITVCRFSENEAFSIS